MIGNKFNPEKLREAVSVTNLKHPIVIIEAPSNLGLKPPSPGKVPGVFRMPSALNSAGIVERLSAFPGERVVPPPYSPERGPYADIRNAEAIRDYSLKLAKAVRTTLDYGAFPLVLGGDCSILLGSALALREMGHYGLFFIDGHRDFLTPETSQTGGAAGMDVALVTGRGPNLLTDINNLKPYFQDADVVIFGYRDVEDPTTDPSHAIFETAITLFDLDHARHIGIRQTASEGLAVLEAHGVEGIWIHLDADILDSEVMPAVDSPQPGGMSYAELGELLCFLIASPLVIGLQATIYDPDRDPDSSIGRKFTDALVAGFGHSDFLSRPA